LDVTGQEIFGDRPTQITMGLAYGMLFKLPAHYLPLLPLTNGRDKGRPSSLYRTNFESVDRDKPCPYITNEVATVR
jgi:hypothetical protein